MKDFQGYAFVVFQGTSDLASVLAKYPNIPINSEHIETVLGLPLPYYRCISMYMISSILYVWSNVCRHEWMLLNAEYIVLKNEKLNKVVYHQEILVAEFMNDVLLEFTGFHKSTNRDVLKVPLIAIQLTVYTIEIVSSCFSGYLYWL